MELVNRVMHPWLSSAARQAGVGAKVFNTAKKILVEAWKGPEIHPILKGVRTEKEGPVVVLENNAVESVNHAPGALSLRAMSEIKIKAAEILMRQGADLLPGPINVILLGPVEKVYGMGTFSFAAQITGFEFGNKSFTFEQPVHYSIAESIY